MAMDKTKAASQASDTRLRVALESGDTSVQIDTRTNKMRDQVARAGFGTSGSARN